MRNERSELSGDSARFGRFPIRLFGKFDDREHGRSRSLESVMAVAENAANAPDTPMPFS